MNMPYPDGSMHRRVDSDMLGKNIILDATLDRISDELERQAEEDSFENYSYVKGVR